MFINSEQTRSMNKKEGHEIDKVKKCEMINFEERKRGIDPRKHDKVPKRAMIWVKYTCLSS